MAKKHLPLIYSCSGCSNVAQLANQVALELTRQGRAEMSCIAGVGGNVKPLVKLAKSGRTILAVDGCQLHCVKHCLAQHDLKADLHYTLTDNGERKRAFEPAAQQAIERACESICDDLGQLVAGSAAS